MKYKTICFDIDNVICTTDKKKNYKLSKPIIKNILTINKLYDANYKIIIYTARYMGRCKGDLKQVEKKLNHLL